MFDAVFSRCTAKLIFRIKSTQMKKKSFDEKLDDLPSLMKFSR